MEHREAARGKGFKELCTSRGMRLQKLQERICGRGIHAAVFSERVVTGVSYMAGGSRPARVIHMSAPTLSNTLCWVYTFFGPSCEKAGPYINTSNYGVKTDISEEG